MDKRILNALNDYQPCSRAELCRITTMARSTVFDVLARLEQEGLVKKQPRPVIKGRPMVEWLVI